MSEFLGIDKKQLRLLPEEVLHKVCTRIPYQIVELSPTLRSRRPTEWTVYAHSIASITSILTLTLTIDDQVVFEEFVGKDVKTAIADQVSSQSYPQPLVLSQAECPIDPMFSTHASDHIVPIRSTNG